MPFIYLPHRRYHSHSWLLDPLPLEVMSKDPHCVENAQFGHYDLASFHALDQCEKGKWADENSALHPDLDLDLEIMESDLDEEDLSDWDLDFVVVLLVVLGSVGITWVLVIWSVVGWWPMEMLSTMPTGSGIGSGWAYLLLGWVLMGATPLPTLYVLLSAAGSNLFAMRERKSDSLAWNGVLVGWITMFTVGTGYIERGMVAMSLGVDEGQMAGGRQVVIAGLFGGLMSVFLVNVARTRGGA